jgi:glycosyltransferase involved in cell wall biosynthesis
MTRPRPLVSAVMPTYNKGPHLQEAIDSVLNQTLPDWELIIVDDGSTDDTATILSRCRDSRITIRSLSRNVGRSCARNLAIGQARGRYIAICDSDDMSVPTRFAQQTAFLDAHPDVGVVSGSIQLLSRTTTARIEYPSDHASIARRFAGGKMGVAHGASIVRGECFARLGLYCEDLQTAEDFELFRRFAAHFQFHALSDVLLYYRHEPTGMPLRMWAENSRAHRYALYRSECSLDGSGAVTFDQFSRRWQTTLAIYTLDLLRFIHFNLRAHVCSHYVVR